MTSRGRTRAMRWPSRLRICLALAGLLGLLSGVGARAQGVSLAPLEPRLDVTRYVVEGDARLSQKEIDALLAPYVGEQKTLSQIEQAAHALEQTLHDRGYVFYRVLVPAQKPVAG